MRIVCPHCNNPIDIVSEQQLSDIECPSCGSSFSLADDSASSTQAYEPTRKLGHFTLIQELGRGAFGTVWKAKDVKLDRIVAIKIPRRDQLSNVDNELFLREARSAARLKHPNIVGVHEVGRDDGTLFIVSDYIDGITLADLLTKDRPSHRESIELISKTARALHVAHENGIVHRDLKPANIMLDVSGEPHIMDFGLAKRDAAEITMTLEGKILGTPAYMSPEQAKGEGHSCDRRADIYSLGVVMFELLTGERPFRGNARMLLHQVLHDEAPRPRTLNNNIPRDLETICLKCLRKEPGRRYQNALELYDDLHRAAHHKPIKARAVSRVEKLWLWGKRRPAVAGLGTLIFFIVVLATFVIVKTESDRIRAAAAAKYNDERRQVAEEGRKRIEVERAETEVQRQKAVRAQAAEAKARERITELKRRVDGLLHGKQLSLALAKWSSGNNKVAQELLEEVRWDLRGWEHGLLRTLSLEGEPRRVKGHEAGVHSIDFSPNGKRLVTGSADSTVKVWSSGDLKELFSLTGHSDDVTCVAFSPDGKLIASGSWDNSVKLWDSNNGDEIATFKNSGPVYCLVFDPSSSFLVAGGAHEDKSDIRLPIGGGLMASQAGQGEVKVWDLETHAESMQITPRCGVVYDIAFSPDGSRFATGASNRQLAMGPGQVIIWDATSGEPICELDGHSTRVHCVTFSPDGTKLASGSEDAVVRVHDIAQRTEVLTLEGHGATVLDVVYSPDGYRIVSSSHDKSFKVWQAEDGIELLTVERHEDFVLALAFSLDSTVLASADWSGVCHIWNTSRATGNRLLKEHAGIVYDVRVSEDGKWIASGAGDDFIGDVRIWDTATGAHHKTLTGHRDLVTSVDFSPDGRTLVSGSWDGNVRHWNLEDGSLMRTFQMKSTIEKVTPSVRDVCFSPDGQHFAVCSVSAIAVWELNGESETWIANVEQDSSTHRVCWSPSGKLIACGASILSFETGEVLRRLKEDGDAYQFSPDGKHIVGIKVENVFIWDVETGSVVRKLKGHTERLTDVAFSPDGKAIVSGGFDKTVRLWDVASGNQRFMFTDPEAAIECVTMTPDGNTILSGGYDLAVRLWELPSPLSLPVLDWSSFKQDKYSWSVLQANNAKSRGDLFALKYHRKHLADITRYK